MISVIMPVYNGATYLADAIESIRTQSDQNWELICVDDGSTDDSPAIVQRYSQADNRIHLESIEHVGIVAALNHGIRVSRGNLIARLDSDDLAKPNRLSLQRDYLNRFPNVAVVGGAFETIDANGRVWKKNYPPSAASDVKNALMKSNCIAHSSVMIRREILSNFTGPYREHFPLAEDYDLWLRISSQHSIENIGEIIMSYRRDMSNIRPDRIALQTVSTLTALCVNQLGMDNQEELFSSHQILNNTNLIDLGIAPEKITAAIARAMLSDARLAKKQGFAFKSQELLSEAWVYRPSQSTWSERLQFYARFLKAKFLS